MINMGFAHNQEADFCRRGYPSIVASIYCFSLNDLEYLDIVGRDEKFSYSLKRFRLF